LLGRSLFHIYTFLMGGSSTTLAITLPPQIYLFSF
jgi:hypothetical protein